jgi:transposase
VRLTGPLAAFGSTRLGAARRLVFSPPYSPDLNPIELIFAKFKQLLRSLARRTRNPLWAAMQSVLDHVSPTDAANCYRHCGYALRMN